MAQSTKDEILQNGLAIFSALVAEHFDGIDPFKIHLADETKTLLKGDEAHFRLVIEDMKEFNQVNEELDLANIFETFPTVESVLEFFLVSED